MRKTTLLLGLLLTAIVAAPIASAAHGVTILNKDEARPGTYTIELDVEKFTLKDFQDTSGQPVKGEGHIHYLVNGEDACSAGKADCSAPTDYATASKTFTFKDLEEGDKITVELVLNDHTASGTDNQGNLNGARVLDSVSVKDDRGVPGFELLALVAAIGAVLALRR